MAAGDRTFTGSVRGKLARRFAAIGIGTALVACGIGYAVTWEWSGTVERDLAAILAGFEGERSEVKASATLSWQRDGHRLEAVAVPVIVPRRPAVSPRFTSLASYEPLKGRWNIILAAAEVGNPAAFAAGGRGDAGVGGGTFRACGAGGRAGRRGLDNEA